MSGSPEKKYRLLKKGSTRTTFYKHEEIPEDVKRVLEASLNIRGIRFNKEKKIKVRHG